MSDPSNQSVAALAELSAELSAAQERVRRATAALAPKHKGGEYQEYHAAREDLLRLERAVAAAKGEPYAVPLEFPVKWSTGAPLPHIICNDDKSFLVFLVNVPDPNWDGSYSVSKSPAYPTRENLALVDFRGCRSTKLGGPNDEVFSGHPLYGRGMEPYAAQVVLNSPWLAELERINAVHRGYRPVLHRGLPRDFCGSTGPRLRTHYVVSLCTQISLDLKSLDIQIAPMGPYELLGPQYEDMRKSLPESLRCFVVPGGRAAARRHLFRDARR